MANYGYAPGAYNPYNPAGSYGYPSPFNTPFNTGYTPALTGQQPTPQVPQNAPQQSNVSLIQAPSIEAARNVIVQPGQAAWIVNQNEPEIYAKAADNMGVVSMRFFKMIEFDPTQEAAKEVLNSQASNLVSREEFNNFAQNVAAQFNALQQNMVAPAPVAVQPIVPQVQPEPTPAPVRGVSKKKEATNDGQ